MLKKKKKGREKCETALRKKGNVFLIAKKGQPASAKKNRKDRTSGKGKTSLRNITGTRRHLPKKKKAKGGGVFIASYKRSENTTKKGEGGSAGEGKAKAETLGEKRFYGTKEGVF